MTSPPRKDADAELDDDLGLDDSMTSMRSMWREMRDEEPSDKGMAALLAAAREKAEEMKPRRSWFAVLLDQLRRPPALAMATVVVLIGGAVVISGREDMKAPTEEVARDDRTNASAPMYPAPASTDPAPAPATGVAPGSGTAMHDNLERSPEGGADEAAAPTVVAESSPTTTPPRARPTNKPTTKSVGQGPRAETKPTDTAFEPAEPSPESPKKDDGETLSIATDGDMQPKGGAVATEAAPNAPAQDKSVSRKPLPSIEGEDRTARDASVAQLVKQCEAAAAKNDCAAVRTIAAKIAKQDPQTYKTKVLKSSNVARCLEPPAPMEAAPEPAN